MHLKLLHQLKYTSNYLQQSIKYYIAKRLILYTSTLKGTLNS